MKSDLYLQIEEAVNTEASRLLKYADSSSLWMFIGNLKNRFPFLDTRIDIIHDYGFRLLEAERESIPQNLDTINKIKSELTVFIFTSYAPEDTLQNQTWTVGEDEIRNEASKIVTALAEANYLQPDIDQTSAVKLVENILKS